MVINRDYVRCAHEGYRGHVGSCKVYRVEGLRGFGGPFVIGTSTT